jgi:hypothetical protein
MTFLLPPPPTGESKWEKWVSCKGWVHWGKKHEDRW